MELDSDNEFVVPNDTDSEWNFNTDKIINSLFQPTRETQGQNK